MKADLSLLLSQETDVMLELRPVSEYVLHKYSKVK